MLKDEIYTHMETTLGLTGSDANEVFQLFLDTLEEQSALMEQAVPARDYAQIRVITHTLTGCANTVGAKALAEAVLHQNAAAKALSPEQTDSAFAEFRKQAVTLLALKPQVSPS